MMKMRIISLLLTLVMLAIVLTGCDTTSEAESQNPFKDRFAKEYLGIYAGQLRKTCRRSV